MPTLNEVPRTGETLNLRIKTEERGLIDRVARVE